MDKILNKNMESKIELPIIVAEGLDIRFYNSISDAELDLEALDIREEVYTAYDSEGKLLSFEIVEDTKKIFFGFMETQIELVKIKLLDNESNHSEELLKLLTEYLYAVGSLKDKERLANLSLKQLIGMCCESQGADGKDL